MTNTAEKLSAPALFTVRHNGDLLISTGKSRFETKWKNKTMSWAVLLNKLSRSQETAETHAEYMALSKAEQDKRKDVGGFVGGSLRGGLRRRGCCTGRSLITLDMDGCAPGSTQRWVAAIKALGTAAVYSTRKHDPEHPRLRAIFPTDRMICLLYTSDAADEL